MNVWAATLYAVAKMKRRRTYEIALAAICTGLILLLLWLSVVVRFGTIALYVVSCGVLMVPLTKKYYLSAILSYIASSLLAFAVVGDIFSILGFVAYFAPMTIFSVVMYERGVKWFISLPIKIVFINAVLALFYFVTGTLFLDFNALGFNVNYAVIALLGTILLVALDYVMVYIYTVVKVRVQKIIRD